MKIMELLKNIQQVKIGKETAYIIDQHLLDKIEEIIMYAQDAKELNRAKKLRRKLAPIDKLKKLLKQA